MSRVVSCESLYQTLHSVRIDQKNDFGEVHSIQKKLIWALKIISNQIFYAVINNFVHSLKSYDIKKTMMKYFFLCSEPVSKVWYIS